MHLVALVAAALLPAFAVGALAVATAVDTYRDSFERRLESTAQALASAVDTEIAGSLLALSTLATARDPGRSGGPARASTSGRGGPPPSSAPASS